MKKHTFRFVLTSLFTILMLFVGGLIVMLNYSQISKILLSSSDKIYESAAENIVLNYRKIYNPALNAINLLSHSLLVDSQSVDDRLKYIRVLSEAIKTEDSITAIQIAYDNGEYFILRKSNTSEIRKKLDAPDSAMFVVDSIEIGNKGSAHLIRLYFDKNINIIKKNKPVKTKYDPRLRPWYKRASNTPTTAEPYYFYFMHKVGTTVSMKMHDSNTVIAMDISLEKMTDFLQKMKMTDNSELYLATSDGTVVISSNPDQKLVRNVENKIVHATTRDIKSQVFSVVPEGDMFYEQTLNFKVDGNSWKGEVKHMGRLGDKDLYLLMFTPVNELIQDAIDIGWMSLYLLFAIIILSFPVIWYVSRRISMAMKNLAMDANQIMNFDFSKTQRLKSRIQEMDDLGCAQSLMKSSLTQFMNLINSLASEKDFDSLLEKITIETKNASKADMVATYLLNEESQVFRINDIQSQVEIDESMLPDFSLSDEGIAKLVTSIDCKYLIQNINTQECWSALKEQFKGSESQVVIFPLRNRQSELMGLLVLAYQQPHQQPLLSFIQAFSEFAAVSLESKQLLKMQEDLLDAFIKLIAGAIDAKSPYTGGHCQRVPEITQMLAQAACDSSATAFKEYQLTKEQWREIDIASWLHDCGKVTTPEYVVDKSTKLETIYDRIHEVRTRFEVLKRDAEIEYWKALANGGNKDSLNANLQQTILQLDDDFEFVAGCNAGGEFMQDENITRLNEIANKTWMRTLDNQLGVSWEEKLRMDKQPQASLPVQEKLLCDKIEHIIERDAADLMPADNKWGFKLDVPEYKYNRGELYNLSVKRGTLSNEERFIINDHMVQTIKMLEALPYPTHLKNVPIIAGCHHESMDGKGYPKRLTKDEMPLTARMMAIADIFEALTASDRPYKKAKTLSESIRIMNSMRKNLHIDSDLFELFLTSGVYLQYAKKCLLIEQIDEVDIQQYLSVA